MTMAIAEDTMKWSAPIMLEAENEAVRKIMKMRCQKLTEKHGGVSMEKVKLLVRCSTMLAMVKKKLAPRQPADVAWA